MSRTIIIQFLLLVVPFWQSYAEDSWIPEVKSTAGQLQFLKSILHRHPRLITQNLQYRRNPIDALRPLSDLRSRLGANAATWEIGDSPILSMEYYDSQNLTYDQKLLADFRENLKNDIQALASSITFDFKSLSEMIDEMKEKLPEKEFEKSAKRLLRVSPIIFDSGGRSIVSSFDAANLQTISTQIDHLGTADVDNLYNDLFGAHLKQIVINSSQKKKLGQLKAWLTSMEKDFIGKTVLKAITPKSADGQTPSKRAISLERIPAPIAVMRGCVGGDCSIHSVPYYPLVKGTRSYWIRKSTGTEGQPQGYAFVIKSEFEGRSVPYVVTINGATLTESDARQVIQTIAADFQSNLILVPDFSHEQNHWLVNTESVRKGMQNESSRPVNAKLPDGWETVVQHLKENSTGYSNYYNSNLSQARSVEVGNAIASRHIVRLPYHKSVEIHDVPVLERGILGGAAVTDGDIQNRQEVMSVLHLTDRQISAGEKLFRAAPSNPIGPDLFAELQRELGMKVQDLAQLDPLTAVESIYQVSTARADLATTPDWEKIWSKAATRLDHTYLNEREGLPRDNRLRVLKTRELVPPQHIEKSLLSYLRSDFVEDSHFGIKQFENAPDDVRKRILDTSGEEVTGIIERLITHSNWEIRRQTIWSLKGVASTDYRINIALINAMRDGDPDVAMAATTQVREIKSFDRRVLTQLVRVLESTNKEHQSAAFQALYDNANLFTGNVELQRELAEFILKTGNILAGDILGQIQPTDSKTLKFLARASSQQKSRDASVRALSSITAKDGFGLVGAISGLQSSEWRVRLQAVQTLIASGSNHHRVHLALVQAAQDHDPDVARAAQAQVSIIKSTDKRVLKELIRALGSQNVNTRDAAYTALYYNVGSLESAGVLPNLIDALAGKGAAEAAEVFKLTQTKNVVLHRELAEFILRTGNRFAGEVLGHLQPTDSKPLKILARASSQEKSRDASVRALSSITAKDGFGLVGAISGLQSSEWRVRLQAVQTLIASGSNHHRVHLALIQTAQDHDPDVARAAQAQVSIIKSTDKRVLKELIRALAANEETKNAAYQALFNNVNALTNNLEFQREIAEFILTTGNKFAGEILGQIQVTDSKTLKILARASSQEKSRVAAAAALSSVRPSKGINLVAAMKRLGSPEWRTRLNAVETLVASGSSHARVNLALIQAAQDHDPDVARAAQAQVSIIKSTDKRVLTELLGLLNSRNEQAKDAARTALFNSTNLPGSSWVVNRIVSLVLNGSMSSEKGVSEMKLISVGPLKLKCSHLFLGMK